MRKILRWLIPFHAKLDEVEPLLSQAKSAIHLGIGDSVVEALWSMNFFEYLVFTDVDEEKLRRLAGFLKENFQSLELDMKVPPIRVEIGLEEALQALFDMRKSLGLSPLKSGFRAKKIKVRVLNFLKAAELGEKFDFVFFFGFTTAFSKALSEGSKMELILSNIKSLLYPSGKAILSDLLPVKDVAPLLKSSGFRRYGDKTFYVCVVDRLDT